MIVKCIFCRHRTDDKLAYLIGNRWICLDCAESLRYVLIEDKVKK